MNGYFFLTTRRIALVALLTLGLSACSEKVDMLPQDELSANEAVGGGSSSTELESVLSIDYDADNDNYYVVGKSPVGDIDVWYGQHNSWTKLQENRDIDNRYSPSQFVDVSIGGEPDEAMFAVAIGNKDGKGTSIKGREFSEKPYFGDGRPEQIGNLDAVLSIDYDADNNQYVVVGVASGQIDVYLGQHKSWTKLQENRDIDNRYKPSEFVDFALGGQGGKFGVAIGNDPQYKVGWRTYEPRATSINCREFYDKPWFGDGKPQPIGTLVRAFAIEYDAANDNYYVVGEGPSGEIDVWYGTHNNWTQLQENRDIDNHYSPSEFVDFALGAEPGEAMFGVAVGNKMVDVNPLNGSNNVDLQQRGTSINAREFSGKPYFGDGRPEIIGN